MPKDGRPTVFIDHRKLSNSVRDHLEQSADVEGPDALTPKLTELAKRGASIALEPANTSYEVRILPPNRVKIQGKLIGLYRKY